MSRSQESFNKKEVRNKKEKKRKEKEGEEQTSLEQFLKEEQIETELEIKNIGKEADVTILNDGSIDDLREKVVAWIQNLNL